MKSSKSWFPIRERWFLWPLLLHLSAWLLLGHVYDLAVFQDASRRLAMGHGVYEAFSSWLTTRGDGYYAYPPFYAYMLWASGKLAQVLGGQWWVYQLTIKMWMLIADLLTVTFLYRISPSAAKSYWTLWYLPIVAIGLVQPDLWVGLSLALAFVLATRGRWFATGLALAAGIGMKMAPIVVLPFLALHLMHTRRLSALVKVAIGVAGGGLLIWLPYTLVFADAARFREILAFHFTRPAAGLNALAGLQRLVDSMATIAVLAGRHLPASHFATEATQRVGSVYPVFTLLFFVALAMLARTQRWSLGQVFCLPLLAFLFSNKVVFEQYALQILPLLLITFPQAWPRMAAPYSVYVIVAGTPWRFFPQEYRLPSTPDALLPISVHATLGPVVMLSFALVAGAAALLFSWQVLKLMRDLNGLVEEGTRKATNPCVDNRIRGNRLSGERSSRCDGASGLRAHVKAAGQ